MGNLTESDIKFLQKWGGILEEQEAGLNSGVYANVITKAMTHVKKTFSPYGSIPIEAGSLLIIKVEHTRSHPEEAAIIVNEQKDDGTQRDIFDLSVSFSEEGIKRYGDVEKQIHSDMFDEEGLENLFLTATNGDKKEVERLKQKISHGIQKAYNEYLSKQK